MIRIIRLADDSVIAQDNSLFRYTSTEALDLKGIMPNSPLKKYFKKEHGYLHDVPIYELKQLANYRII